MQNVSIVNTHILINTISLIRTNKSMSDKYIFKNRYASKPKYGQIQVMSMSSEYFGPNWSTDSSPVFI